MSALAARSHPYPRALHLAPWLILASLLVALPGGLAAQPFGAWLTLPGHPSDAYVEIADSPDLDPTGAITVEAWVDISRSGSQVCNSIVGKGWSTSWWLGICGDPANPMLRSYIRGYDGAVGSTRVLLDGGRIPPGQWTHVALVFDGVNRYHYINGELVASHVEAGPATTSTFPVRIGGDASYNYSPAGAIDEVRIWSVARSQAQIRAAINTPILGPQPGLVAVWGLDGNTLDRLGAHNGAGHGSIGFFTFPVAISCGASTSSSLCLNGRFAVSATYRIGGPGTAEGAAHTVSCPNPGSGLFWFFSPDNWEVMVKTIDACGLNDRFWLFSAATTNVFYRLEVFDIRAGVNKVYFNYSGPPAPAVTDTSAFATCP